MPGWRPGLLSTGNAEARLPKGCWQEMPPKVTKLTVLPQPNFASEQHFLSSLWAQKAPPRAGALSGVVKMDSFRTQRQARCMLCLLLPWLQCPKGFREGWGGGGRSTAGPIHPVGDEDPGCRALPQPSA